LSIVNRSAAFNFSDKAAETDKQVKAKKTDFLFIKYP
jgi:hypothetical protein